VFFLSLLSYSLSAALRLWTQVRLWTLSDSDPGNSFYNVRRRSSWKHNSTPPSCVFSHLHTISRISSCVKVADVAASPFNATTYFCCVKNSCILTFYNPKSLLSINFSTSHFEPIIHTLPIYSFFPMVGANCCEFEQIITPIKLTCMEKRN